jgi:cell division protein FtsQ
MNFTTTLNLHWLLRRNRFKNRSKEQKRAPRWSQLLLQWRTLVKRGLTGLSAVCALAGIGWALDRPLQSIAMDGSFQRVSPGQIEKAVEPFTHAGFMSADLDGIQRAVEAVPWVDHARIQRRWPNSLHVSVIEQTAAARWGESGLLNTRGELFLRAAIHVPAELPRLSGPEGAESVVAERFMAVQGRMLEAGMRVASLRLDERGAWELDLDSGVTVRLGRRDVDQRIDRFMRTASQVIAHRMNEIAYVDMRYSNGFAIGWRNPQAPPSTPAKRAEDT